MGLTSTERALLTARAGKARAGASRSAFTPKFTQGSTPGSAGGFYIWRRKKLPTTTWTPINH